MSIVDGCVLVVCSGADGHVRPPADWTDETAPDASERNSAAVSRQPRTVVAPSAGSRRDRSDRRCSRYSTSTTTVQPGAMIGSASPRYAGVRDLAGMAAAQKRRRLTVGPLGRDPRRIAAFEAQGVGLCPVS